MWKRFDVIFTLKGPLHIGYLPFQGSVISPTRYYIPGKNFWGAITKRATEYLHNEPKSDDYKKIGKKIIKNFRFSYFYLYDGKTIFIPKYTDSGLVFGEEDKIQIDKFGFEQRFIGSRVLTAIDSKSGTAKDETLHEIEFIKHKFIAKDGSIKGTRIIGCIWIREGSNLNSYQIESDDSGIFVNGFNLIKELTLGGEQGYGFGKVKLEKILNEKRFPIKLSETAQNSEIEIKIQSKKSILSHFKYEPNVPFQGEIELLIVRGYFDIEEQQNQKEESEQHSNYKINPGKTIMNKGYYFSPGTRLKKEIKEFILHWDGTLQHQERKGQASQIHNSTT